MSIPFLESNDQTQVRSQHLDAIRALVGNPYPSKFERSNVSENPIGEDTITSIIAKFKSHEPKRAEGEKPAADEIARINAELNRIAVSISGRLATPPRVMGKVAFVHLSDGASRLQIFVKKGEAAGARNDASNEAVDGWTLFELLDHGDFIGVAGYLFVTKTGELSVHVSQLKFLSKAMLPMPDKMHGIADPEIRQRQRYADLLASSLKIDKEEDELTTREVFERRAQIVREMRRILDDHGYIEVETPMLTSKATGAAARPFKTHHNALDIDLYARIAPELYLKRLTVGGFERVYELNRNFRNEGISVRHNPEFTMLEFYCAYMDSNGMMDFCEQMLRAIAYKTLGHTHARFGQVEIDFSKVFERLSMKMAIARYWPDNHLCEAIEESVESRISTEWLGSDRNVCLLASILHRWHEHGSEELLDATSAASAVDRDEMLRGVIGEIAAEARHALSHASETIDVGHAGRQMAYLFETVAEHHLNNPTFIVDFPKPISPLSKASPTDPLIAERFELFIAGMEVANGFSELNDPAEQYERFLDQAEQRERGDEEAMVLDEDYIRALSYGMPPAAGIGIGVDRITMLLTNRRSIRDVILFPHMRPARPIAELESE